MIRVTFAAEPRRRLVLLAKALDGRRAGFVVGLATALLAYGAIAAQRQWLHAPVYSGGDRRRAAAGGGIALYLTALALFSLAIGAILRSTAGAVTFVLSLLLLPLIAAPLLGERTGVFDSPMTPGCLPAT